MPIDFNGSMTSTQDLTVKHGSQLDLAIEYSIQLLSLCGAEDLMEQQIQMFALDQVADEKCSVGKHEKKQNHKIMMKPIWLTIFSM